ncbi:MAG TPA: oligosaccharide flippase family protein, partial [Beijerinckiaceae bacterium]
MTASRLSRGFLLGAGLMAGSEMVNRAARIVTAIVLARTLEVTEFGVAAVVLTTWELVRMLTHNGLGARIVAARPDELAATCRHVHRLNWGVGITIFVVQCALAYPVAHAFDRPDVAPMLLALAATYLVYPFVMVRAFLAQRDPRLVFTAAAGSLQLVIDSLGSALLALAGAGVWSVVVPKLLIAPLWVVVHRAYAPAPPQERGRDDGARAILSFSARVFAAEALNTLRNNMDRIVVGRVLGLEALGTYSFAVNAGVGNTQSLATALGAAILPYLSAVGGDLRARFFASMAVTAAGIVPIVVLQAA